MKFCPHFIHFFCPVWIAFGTGDAHSDLMVSFLKISTVKVQTALEA